MHGFIVENRRSSNVEGESTYFTFRLSPTCHVTVVFGPVQDELKDDMTFQLIRHFAQKISDGHAWLSLFPLVYDGICVIIQYLTL